VIVAAGPANAPRSPLPFRGGLRDLPRPAYLRSSSCSTTTTSMPPSSSAKRL